MKRLLLALLLVVGLIPMASADGLWSKVFDRKSLELSIGTATVYSAAYLAVLAAVYLSADPKKRAVINKLIPACIHCLRDKESQRFVAKVWHSKYRPLVLIAAAAFVANPLTVFAVVHGSAVYNSMQAKVAPSSNTKTSGGSVKGNLGTALEKVSGFCGNVGNRFVGFFERAGNGIKSLFYQKPESVEIELNEFPSGSFGQPQNASVSIPPVVVNQRSDEEEETMFRKYVKSDGYINKSLSELFSSPG